MSKDLELDLKKGKEDEKETKKEESWSDIVSDFDSPEKLAQAYKELKEKSSGKLSEDDEKFRGQIKEFFGDTLSESSKLENSELKSLSHSIRDKMQIPTRVLDAVVAKVAASVLEKRNNNNLADSKSFLEDKLKKQALEQAISKMNKEDQVNFQNRLKAGAVSKYELDALTRGVSEGSSADTSFDFGKETTESTNREDLHKEYMEIVRGQSHIWTNPLHPQYKQVNLRKAEISDILGLIK